MDKLLFFDIDGTLAYPRLSPSSATVNAIRKARSNGHKVLLCTGRTVDSIPTAVACIGFDGGIFSAGGLVMLGNTILAQHFMADKVVQNTLTLLYRKSLFFTLETTDGRYCSENGHEILSQVDMTCISNEMPSNIKSFWMFPNKNDRVHISPHKVRFVIFVHPFYAEIFIREKHISVTDFYIFLLFNKGQK